MFIDFKRAFETIDRNRLIGKLEGYGLGEKVLKLFKTYLVERFQKTKYGSEMSAEAETRFGVPQGSVLGPTLFTLYINDIKSAIHNCSVNLFADDTILFYCAKDVRIIEQKMNEDLKLIDTWLAFNSLKSNSSKSKCMLINSGRADSSQKINIFMSGEKLEQVLEIKYLGVIVDYKLNFKSHVEYITKKIAKKINFLSRISNDISLFTRITIYKSIISPHFEYCGTILYLLNQTDMQLLQKLQNRAMRVILKCNRYTPITVMLDTLQFMSVKQRIYYNTIIFIFKIKEGLLPDYLNDRIQYVHETHEHNTRQKDDFYIKLKQRNYSQNYLYFNGLRLFNTLPGDIKTIKKLNHFKRVVNTYIKSNF